MFKTWLSKNETLAPFLDFDFYRLGPGQYTMPNFSSGDPVNYYFEIKPKAAFLELVTQKNGMCRQVNKFTLI